MNETLKLLLYNIHIISVIEKNFFSLNCLKYNKYKTVVVNNIMLNETTLIFNKIKIFYFMNINVIYKK